MSFFDPNVVFQHGCPDSITDILMESFFFAFFGLILYIGAKRQEILYGKTVKWIWASYVLLGISMLFGIQRMYFLHDYTYTLTITSRKQLWSHWGALGIPIAAVVGILVYNFRQKRTEGKRVY